MTTVINYRNLVSSAMEEFLTSGYWKTKEDETWIYYGPPASTTKYQGWKIHISAIPSQGEAVLSVVVPILAKAQTGFKFTKDVRKHEQLISSRIDRGSGGKFITVYPSTDDAFVGLIEELHDATKEFVGPGILSDFRYKNPGIVYYRFGGFKPHKTLGVDGSFQFTLIAPNGDLVPDERNAWPSTPDWVENPLTDGQHGETSENDSGSKSVLLGSRYKVIGAIRHSYRGGVYRALDIFSGEKAIIKQARQYTGADRSGNDATNWLDREAAALKELSSGFNVPRYLAKFEQQGDSFLAIQEIDGENLRSWMKRYEDLNGKVRPAWEIKRIFLKIVKALGKIHDQGYIIRDFNPANIMVDRNEEPIFIDFEFICRPKDEVRHIQTRGYSAPEVFSGERVGRINGFELDIYGFGMSLFRACTGIEPVFLPDEGAKHRSTFSRISYILRQFSRFNPEISAFEKAILESIAEDPAERPSWKQLEEILEETRLGGVVDVNNDVGALQTPQKDQSNKTPIQHSFELIEDGLSYLLHHANWEGEQVWEPYKESGLVSDTLNVQGGVGGVLVMLNAIAKSKCPTLIQDISNELKSQLSDWIARKLQAEDLILPGLYFGRTGTALALAESAQCSQSEKHLEIARNSILRAPADWYNPDVTHGIAGLGLACLKMYQLTEDDIFAERAKIVSRQLSTIVINDNGAIKWATRKAHGSNRKGITHYGFAHGVAGICYFLEKFSKMGIGEDFSKTTERCRELLLEAAIWRNNLAFWPTGEPGSLENGLCWWCSGSTGVGLYLMSKKDLSISEEKACRGAAEAAWNRRCEQSTTACHGLGSAGQFLLNMYEKFGDEHYLEKAWDVAEMIYFRSGYKDDRLVIPSDDFLSVECGYNVGMSGPMAFLNRLNFGGTMPLMMDDPL